MRDARLGRRSALVGCLVALCCGGPVLSQSEGRASLRYDLAGLTDEVSISKDRWGVSHIRAANEDDLFFAQGFNAARDRMWQLDLWKRRGEGLLSEAFGSEFVEQDRAARLLLYRGDMYAEWLAYGSDTKRIVTSFVRGINAFIDLCAQRPELLPPEFRLLGYRPSRWTPESVVRIRSSGLVRNARSEARRARAVAELGERALPLRDALVPSHRAEIPDGLDVSLFEDDDVLEVYSLGTSGVDLEPPAGDAAAFRGPSPSAGPWLAPPELWQGSNNWAVAGSRTATGRPILADDPHRSLAVPSLRYLVHLTAPGLDVIGAGEPALPGISIGHNGTVAFGLTVFSIDQEDLYVYETRSNSYRYGDGWEEMREVTETVLLRGGGSTEVVLRFTRHGPVIHQRASSAVALRAAWLEPGMAPYLASLSLMRARDWQEFRDAMNRWGAPSENQVYADTSGNIGWKPGGRWPVRPNWDGLLPVPGDGRYEWAGYHDMDALPFELNPERGYIATANEHNLPAEHAPVPGYEWAAPFRVQRIREVLESQPRHSMDDSVALQNDVLSLPARRVTRWLCRGEQGTEGEEPSLCSWDHRLQADSAAAALFEVWYRRHLLPEVLRHVAPSAEIAEAIGTPDARLGLAWLDRLGSSSQPEGESLADLMQRTLRAARAELVELLGADASTWRWGELHRARLRHPLADRFPEHPFTIPSVARGGSSDTVGNTSYASESFDQRGGATFRMVLDVGRWDRSRAINSPGQSGVPESRHYADLLEPWARGEAFPLIYSRKAVDRETRERVVLAPRP